MQFPGGGEGRFSKTTQFKEMYEAEWNFQRGVGGVLDKIPSSGEALYIYSNIVHSPTSHQIFVKYKHWHIL